MDENHGLYHYQILTLLMKKLENHFIKQLERSLILGLNKMNDATFEFQTQPWQSNDNNELKKSFILQNPKSTLYTLYQLRKNDFIA